VFLNRDVIWYVSEGYAASTEGLRKEYSMLEHAAIIIRVETAII
jgi:hypothetical protein